MDKLFFYSFFLETLIIQALETIYQVLSNFTVSPDSGDISWYVPATLPFVRTHDHIDLLRFSSFSEWLRVIFAPLDPPPPCFFWALTY